jgi:hypothetical protein
MTNNIRKKLANDLEKMMNGKITEAEVYNRYLTNKEYVDITANLDHYFSDEDFRKESPKYKQMQENELKKFIKLLRHQGTVKELNDISFLESS